MSLRPGLPFALLLVGAATSAFGCGDEALSTVPTQAVFGPLGDRADLPVKERISIANLGGPVDVVRDRFGRPHIYATSLTDAMRVEGYLAAKDRTLQIEFFRRVAEGRMAELLGSSDPSLIDLDISYRHIGLHRSAKAQYAALPEGGEQKAILDAYADGISQLFAQIRSKEVRLPEGIFAIDEDGFGEFTGVDALAIARLQQHLLSYSGDEEIRFEGLLGGLKGAFSADDPDPKVAVRAGVERDLLRFAPATQATTTDDYPKGPPSKLSAREPRSTDRRAEGRRAALAASASGYVAALARARELLAPEGFGSNNWALSGSLTASGRALVASDPHLPLSAPAVFWPVDLTVSGEESLALSGVSFPGIPGIILGTNGYVAWGATVAGYDVTDVYEETLTEDGQSVLFQGSPVALETIEEVIAIQGRDPYTYSLKLVPHHGPIAPTILPDHTVAPPDPAAGAMSVRWTGHELTNDLEGILGLLRAKDVDEARTALRSFGVGAQNWMLADTSGNILWTSHALVPTRAPGATDWDASTYEGTLPCRILPGDGSAEWTGFLADDLVPWAKNPPSGYLATANNDLIGDTLDNDPTNDTLPDGTPMFTACTYDIGFREERIQQRITTLGHPATPADMAAIQADSRSALGARLAPALVSAIDRAEEELDQTGTHPDLAALVADPTYDSAKMQAVRALLDGWGAESDFDAASGIDPETNTPLPSDTAEARAASATLVFNTWLVRVLRRTFGDELARIGVKNLPREAEAKAFLRLLASDPATLATFDPATGDSALWDDLDTAEIESRSERLVRALLDALAWLDTQGGADPTALRWGAFHTVSFEALVPVFGALSIPPSDEAVFVGGFPRHGDSFAVDSSDFTFSVSLENDPSFSYAHGPSQRFVADMDPVGVRTENALPGGNVWDAASPHFRDEAELWRRNQTHPIPFTVDEVVANAEERTVITP